MVLDTRSIGAIGLQADSFVGIMLVRVCAMIRLRRLIWCAVCAWPTRPRPSASCSTTRADSVAKPVAGCGRAGAGRRLFFDEPPGTIINQQILVDLPPPYQGSELAPPCRSHRRDAPADSAHFCPLCGPALGDDTEHQETDPGRGPCYPRCTDCHFSHRPKGFWAKLGLRKGEGPGGFASIFDEFDISRMASTPKEERARCVAAMTSTPRWPNP